MLWQLRCTWELLTVPASASRVRPAAIAHSPAQQAGAARQGPVPGTRSSSSSQAEAFRSTVSPLPFPRQDWTRCPSLVFAVLFPSRHNCVWTYQPDRAHFPVGRRDIYSPRPCMVSSVLCLKFQPLPLDPSLELSSGPTTLHLQRKSFKTFGV